MLDQAGNLSVLLKGSRVREKVIFGGDVLIELVTVFIWHSAFISLLKEVK